MQAANDVVPFHSSRASAVLCKALEEEVWKYIAQLRDVPRSLRLWQHRNVHVACQAHQCLRHGKCISKRDVYYTAPGLFARQSNADAAVRRVARTLGVHSNELNIVAAQKSLVSGDLSFADECGNYVKLGAYEDEAIFVPARPERLPALRCGATKVLVIEKETVFARVLAARHTFTDKCFLTLTGKGYPDDASRLLLRRLCAERTSVGLRPPTVMVLTDADPDGAHIALSYAAAVPPQCMRWIGLHAAHLCGHVADSAWIPITSRERKMARNLMSRFHSSTRAEDQHYAHLLVPLMDSLAYQLQHGVKLEIEALATANAGGPDGMISYIAHAVANTE